MSRIPHIFTLGLVGVAAAGCTLPPLNNDARQYYSADQRFPITIEPQVATLAVQVDSGLHRLARGEEARIAMFAERWKTRGQGLVNIATPSGGGGDDGALAQLKQALAASGVAKDAIQLSTYNPASGETQAPITLSYVAYAATAPECGTDWSQNFANDPRNVVTPNFGCSTQHNMAALIANPQDLIEPQASAPIDAQRRGAVVEHYQKGEKTHTERDTSDVAYSSKVGTN